MDMDNDDRYSEPQNKRFRPDPKVDPTNPQPSIVVHVRNLSARATEADLLEALSGFGQIAYATVMTNKRMALVEFEDIEAAKKCVSFAATKTINVAGLTALFNFSTSPFIQRLGLECERPNHILILTVTNETYPVNVDTINEICSQQGEVRRIAIIRRRVTQVLVEFDSVATARKAKYAMNGADIYSGCCTLKVEFAKPDVVKVTRNDETQWDYTRPDLPGPHIGFSKKPALLGGSTPPHVHLPRHDDYAPPPTEYYRSQSPPGRTVDDYYRRDDSRRPGFSGTYSNYDDDRRPMPPEQSAVIMVYGTTHEGINCEKLFNILCQYGNVLRIKFMKKKTDTVMVEMGTPGQVNNTLQFLQGLEMFGCTLTIRPSKQPEVREQGAPFALPDGSPSFRDYSGSRNQRYSTVEHASRNRICAPTKTLHWFNAPPDMSEQRVVEIFTESGAPPPIKVTINPARSEKSRAGTCEFETVAQANEALALGNHSPVTSVHSKMPYIVKMAYFAPTSNFHEERAPSRTSYPPSRDQRRPEPY